MKREEAIKCIKELIKSFYNCRGEENATEVSLDDVDMEALDMAVKALEQETAPFDFELYQAGLMIMPKGMIEVLDNIEAEIEALPKTYPFINHIDTYVKEDDVRKIIDKCREESEEVHGE